MAVTAAQDTQQPDAQQQQDPSQQHQGVDEAPTKDRIEVCLLLAIEKAAKASEIPTGQDFGQLAGGCKDFAQAALFLAQAYAQLQGKPAVPGQPHQQSSLFAQTAPAGPGSGIAPGQSAEGGYDQSAG